MPRRPTRRAVLVTLPAAALLATGAPISLTRAVAAAEDKPGSAEGKWKPLFDGKTLAGWHPIGQGEWTVKDGAILGRNKKANDFGHLVSDASYTDFTVRMKYKSVAGNSGFYFRIKPEGGSGVSGFQAEIDPKVDVGGLYETNGRAWVSQPTPEQVKTWFKPGEWNEMTVAAKGRDITVTVNGKTSAELKNDPGKWTEGPFALQLHGGQDCEVWFKDIELFTGEAK